MSDSPPSPGAVIFFESYLHVVTDVAFVMKNWKKRWFTLYHLDPFNPNSMMLTYYSDFERKEKKGSISVNNIAKVSPISGRTKDHIFCIEMTDEKKLVLKAADARTKNIWLAKLLEGCSKDGQTVHVTVPSQPTTSYAEAILKLGAPMAIKVVSPSTGETVLEVPFQQIRRFGCQVYLDSDIIWFETCGCKAAQQQFYFFVVASGIEKALSITQNLKKSIECTTRSLLIQEEGDEMTYQYSYISRKHYGCSEYSAFARDRVLSASLMHLAASTSASGAISIGEMNKFKRQRTSVPFIHMVPASSSSQAERRSTLADIQGMSSPDPSHSPVPGSRAPFTRSPSPGHVSPIHSTNMLSRKTLAEKCRLEGGVGIGLSHSAGQAEFDSGITLDAIDQSRFSAPVPGSPRQKLEDTHKMKSFDEKFSGRSPKLSGNAGARKTSLATLHDTTSVVNYVKAKKFSREHRHDSAVGSAELIIDAEDISSSHQFPDPCLSPAPPLSSYDHLAPATGRVSPRLPPRGNGGISLAAYDHLDSSFAGLSLKNALSKQKGAAYVES